MSNKLTKKKIDLLIEQVLNEKKIKLTDIPDSLKSAEKKIYKKKNSKSKNSVQALAKNDKDEKNISIRDIETAYTDRVQDELGAIDFLDTSLNRRSGKNDVYNQLQTNKKQAAININKDAGKLDFTTGDSIIKKKDMQDVVYQYDLANATMQDSVPTLSPALKNVFDFLGMQSDTLFGRLKKLSEFSNNLIDAYKNKDSALTALNEMGTLKFIQFTMAIDYLSTIAKNVDAGAGAYLFETFLAALAGGTVTGKETTAKGTMGGADFTLAGRTNARGSSKYLKDTTKPKQAVSGFEKAETVHYVIAEKTLDTPSNKKESSLDIDQVIGFRIYYPVLHVIVPQRVFRFIDHTGKQIDPKTEGEFMFQSEGSISIPKMNFVGELKLVSAYGEKFRKVLNKVVDKTEDKIKNAFTKFQSSFDKVSKAKESVASYSVSGKQNDGDAAINDLISYKQELAALFRQLKDLGGEKDTGYQEPEQATVDKLKENKTKSLKELDKLIEHVILNKINK
jgi:hypothetical protein